MAHGNIRIGDNAHWCYYNIVTSHEEDYFLNGF